MSRRGGKSSCEMIENIPTPLVSFVGSGVAGFFMGMFPRSELISHPISRYPLMSFLSHVVK